MAELKRTGLHDLHVELGAKMVPFAGYEMPVQYPAGVLTEHLHTRAKAGLFRRLAHGPGDPARRRPGRGARNPRAGGHSGARRTEVPALRVLHRRPGRASRRPDDREPRPDHLFLVVNAARKAHDIRPSSETLSGVTVEPVTDRALLALQGPRAEAVLAEIVPEVRPMRFMDLITVGDLWISPVGLHRRGRVRDLGAAATRPKTLARRLIADEYVLPIGLGGTRLAPPRSRTLSLWRGHRRDHEPRSRPGLPGRSARSAAREGAREGGFPGAGRVLDEIRNGTPRASASASSPRSAPRCARAPRSSTEGGEAPVGHVTSGAYGPSVEAPVSMGYVATGHSADGTLLQGEVRGKRLPVRVVLGSRSPRPASSAR